MKTPAIAPVVPPAVRAPAARPPLWNTHHAQPEPRRVALIALLNARLADVLDLRLQAKQAHWNVKGPRFAALHALFDEVADELDGFADELAERAVVLGGVALGTLQTLARDSRLLPYPAEALAENDHLWALSAALANTARSAREAIHAAEKTGDAVAIDVLTEVTRGLDTLLWKVEAHVALEPRWEPSG
jgi:starvation-inducible DNA-binding protein